MADTHDIGDRVRLAITFRDAANAAADPTTVQLLLKTPAGVESIYTAANGVENPSVGSYYLDLTLLESGTYYWRWNGTGTVEESTEGFSKVRTSRFADPLPLGAVPAPGADPPDTNDFLQWTSDGEWAPSLWTLPRTAPVVGDVGKVLTVSAAGASAFQVPALTAPASPADNGSMARASGGNLEYVGLAPGNFFQGDASSDVVGSAWTLPLLADVSDVGRVLTITGAGAADWSTVLTKPVDPTDDGKMPRASGGSFVYVGADTAGKFVLWSAADGWVASAYALPLTIGNANDVLTVSGGAATWAPASGGAAVAYQPLAFGAGQINTGTNFLYPGAGIVTAVSSSEANAGREQILRDGTLKNLRATHPATVATDDLVYTLMLNGVETAFAITLSSGSVSGSAPAATLAVVAGDLVGWRATGASVNRATRTRIQYELEYAL